MAPLPSQVHVNSYFGKLWDECVSCGRFSQFICGLGLVGKGLVVWGLVDGLWVDAWLLSGDILGECGWVVVWWGLVFGGVLFKVSVWG